MAIKSLLPSLRRKTELPSKGERNTLSIPAKEMNRLFDDFSVARSGTFRCLEDRYSGFSPSIDVRESGRRLYHKGRDSRIDEKMLKCLSLMTV